MNKQQFDINTNAVLMTFKDAGLSKAAIIQNVLKVVENKGPMIAVGREPYKNNNGYHYHVWVLTTVKHRWTMKELDSVGGIHGNYKRITETPRKCLAYIVKDGDFSVWPEQYMKHEVQQAINIYAYQNAQYKMNAMLKNLADEKEDIADLKPRNFKKETTHLGPSNVERAQAWAQKRKGL